MIHIIGVTPDLEVKVRVDVLEEIDGPMLLHARGALRPVQACDLKPAPHSPRRRGRLCYAPPAAGAADRRGRQEAAMSLPNTMQATVLVAPHRFELQARPVPEPGPEDVLVRVRACGV